MCVSVCELDAFAHSRDIPPLPPWSACGRAWVFMCAARARVNKQSKSTLIPFYVVVRGKWRLCVRCVRHAVGFNSIHHLSATETKSGNGRVTESHYGRICLHSQYLCAFAFPIFLFLLTAKRQTATRGICWSLLSIAYWFRNIRSIIHTSRAFRWISLANKRQSQWMPISMMPLGIIRNASCRTLTKRAAPPHKFDIEKRLLECRRVRSVFGVVVARTKGRLGSNSRNKIAIKLLQSHDVYRSA